MSGCFTTRELLLSCLLLAQAISGTATFADELDNPPVPQSDATSGMAAFDAAIRVALIDAGVNYLLPEISRSLARDENGELVGYDFWDMDERPFDSHPDSRGNVQRHGTQTASLLVREAPFVELVPYRYPRPDMSRMAELIAHADQRGVRIIGMPLGGNQREQWDAFERSANDYPHILFVASAGNNGRDIDQQAVYPAALSLPNMVVVTSADDFGRLADGVNWGRVSVDYMVPAEHLQVLRFDGTEGLVSGSSYAVPRVVALAARLLQSEPKLMASELLKRVRRLFANGSAPRQLAEGYLYDPQFSPEDDIFVAEFNAYRPSRVGITVTRDDEQTSGKVLVLPLQVLVLDPQWQTTQVMQLLDDAASILAQCHIVFDETRVSRVQGPDYIRDLETGSARTLMGAVRDSGANRKLTVVLARDTLMSMPFDAEAFGRGNTRHRPWLTDSVWLTLALQDRAIALAHELFHVLINSGDHSTADGSLMLARTTGSNTRLTKEECTQARERALDMGLVRPGPAH
ncbi:MAG: S8 family serine peptidase [Granulosicoccus sp.]